ncbi:DUF4249 family protein [Marinifilum sp. RC60d5]|uniref:DUF4249 family protein n=1 Tax=Marinifilum sp. RC60d5 TaxID=3458414 RepID=UPI004035531C
MLKHIVYILTITLLLFSACTKVVNVDVPEADSKLVIEASLDWEKNTSGNVQNIKLSKSTPYFSDDQNITVTGAVITVTDKTSNQEFKFEDQNNGEYLCTNFIPIINRTYSLKIIYEEETYTAEEILQSLSGISKIDQSVENGFDDEAIEINIYIPDPANEPNYYMLKYYERGDLLSEISDLKDEFIDGNEIKLFWEKQDDDDTNEEEFKAGDIVDIQLYGISESYYNYISILSEQSESGNPFSTIPVALKGNCINTTNPDNTPYGYFRLSQYVQKTYTVQ